MTMRIDPDNRHNLDWLVAIVALLALAGCLLVEGCTPTEQSHPAMAAAQSIGDAQAEVADAVEDPVSDAQRNVAVATTSAVVAAQIDRASRRCLQPQRLRNSCNNCPRPPRGLSSDGKSPARLTTPAACSTPSGPRVPRA